VSVLLLLQSPTAKLETKGPLAGSLNIATITVLNVQTIIPVATDCFSSLENGNGQFSDNEVAYSMT
jgi:hypothetical protein